MALSRSMSAAIAGLRAHQTAMDVIGNNIANVNTYGFRSSTAMFRDVMYQTLTAGSKGAGTEGGTNPSQIGYGSTVSAVEKNVGGSTSMTVTNNSNDCYISGEGYFIVDNGTTTDGATTTTQYLYSRVGDNLRLDNNGFLVDGAGRKICGAGVDSDGKITGVTDGKIAAPAAIQYTGFATNPLKNISIGQDGTITAQKSDGSTATLGQIGLAYFPNPAGLTAVGNSYYTNDGGTGNTGAASYYTPGNGSTGKIVTGALEASNVDLANEFSNMIQMERGFQANTKIVTVNDEMLQTLVNMKN